MTKTSLTAALSLVIGFSFPKSILSTKEKADKLVQIGLCDMILLTMMMPLSEHQFSQTDNIYFVP